jgi:hypothetical protein
MLLESSDLLEKIIVELRDLMSEATIVKAMITPMNEKKQPKDAYELIEFLKTEAKESHNLNSKMKFLEGKMDAYVQVLKIIGYNDIVKDL